MKIEDVLEFDLEQLDEIASPGMTSVSTLGTLEFRSSPSMIRLFKRDECDKPSCVAKIRRKPYSGWRLVTTEEWQKFNLPHFGNLNDVKTDINGEKTISNDIKNILKKWGMSVEEIKRLENNE